MTVSAASAAAEVTTAPPPGIPVPPWRGAGARAAAGAPLAIAELKVPMAAPTPAAPPVAARPGGSGGGATVPRMAPPEAPASNVAPAETPSAEPAGPDPVEHPLVQEAIRLFNARIVDVQPKRD